MIDHVFVYGTLLPGDVRWRYLAAFATDEGQPDSVDGTLFDTGLDYPAAVFGLGAPAEGKAHGVAGTILGRTFRIPLEVLEDCLAVLDVEEDIVGGRYRRISVTTHLGTEVWVYEYGDGLDLAPIPSGDWLAHRPVHLALELSDD
jgi:gamma-glutamylcyclotransferase (GGCT)/AIG2-like uncharacterized protein YtfP